MSHAAAFGIGGAIGFTMSVLMTVAVIPRLAHKTRPAKPAWGRACTFVALLFAPPLIGAVLMPDFKTGVLLWIGDGVGYVLTQSITLPLRHRARSRR